MPKKKPKLPEHLRGKTPEEITEYIMGGMVRGQPEGETIGDYFAKARRKAAEQARKNEAAGMIEWEEGEWISPAEFRSRQLAAKRAHTVELERRGYRERDVAATPIMGALRTANALGNARALAASQGLRTIPENWQNYLAEAQSPRERRQALSDYRKYLASRARKKPEPQEQLWTPW